MDAQPGMSVAGRYRLDRRLVSSGPGPDATESVSLWRGRDEILDRPVAVRLIAADHPRTDAVLEAARSTACVEDPRIARVLDAATDPDTGAAHVVTAWAPGQDLAHLLADGPLDADESLALMADVADAIRVAHASGLAHLSLDPTDVVVDGDEVTVLGIAVDTVLWDDADPAADTARADAAGLGALLYACLTARWPHGEDLGEHGLPAAPQIGGRLAAPRQVRAAVPAGTDTLCRRALGTDPLEPPIASPAEFADAVRDLRDGNGRRWSPTTWWRRGTRGAAATR